MKLKSSLIAIISIILMASCNKTQQMSPNTPVQKVTRGSKGIANRTYTGMEIQPLTVQPFDLWIGTCAEYLAPTNGGNILKYDNAGNFISYVTVSQMNEDVQDYILCTDNEYYYPSADLNKSVTEVQDGMSQVSIFYEKKKRGSRGIAN